LACTAAAIPPAPFEIVPFSRAVTVVFEVAGDFRDAREAAAAPIAKTPTAA
jgi:hypothetical protein